MGTAVKRALRISLGVLLLLIGAIGGFIPIFQGWIFGLAGLALLAQDVPLVRRWHEYAKKRTRELRKRKQPDGKPHTATSRAKKRDS